MNTVFRGDNLEYIKTIDSNSINLIYSDILYGTGRKFKDYQDIKSNKEEVHLFYRERIKEFKRVLKDSGSLYLQMDSRISHWLRDMLDDEFGYSNYRNTIFWKREGSKGAKAKSKSFCKNSDIILFYTKSKEYKFNKLFIPYTEEYIKRYFKKQDDGVLFSDVAMGTRLSTSTLEELELQNRVYTTRTGGKRYKKFLSEMNGKAIGDIWDDISPLNSNSKEKKDYDTQKPVELMDRIVLSSSDEGDLVADFFCGSGAFLVSAKKNKRNYIGCDLSERAVEITKERLK